MIASVTYEGPLQVIMICMIKTLTDGNVRGINDRYMVRPDIPPLSFSVLVVLLPVKGHCVSFGDSCSGCFMKGGSRDPCPGDPPAPKHNL